MRNLIKQAARASDCSLAWSLGIIVAILAAWMCEPGVGWLDSGELAAAAWGLGISHPPGQPLHALLGKLATFVPIGEIGFRVTLISALSTGALAAGTYRLARTVVPDDAGSVRALALLAAACATASQLTWAQAVRTEVYATTAALCVWGLWLLARSHTTHGSRRDIATAALLWGFAASLHPLVAALLAAPTLLFIAWHQRRELLAPWAPVALALGVLGLAVIAYLPLRAGAVHAPALAWGDPQTMDRLWNVLRARDYAQNFTSTGLLERAAACTWLLAEGPGSGLLLLGTVGLVFAALTGLAGVWALGASVAGLVGATAAVGLFYPDNPDVHGYLAPALALLAVGTVALGGVARRLGGVHAPWVLVAPLAIGIALSGSTTVHARYGGSHRTDDPPRLWAETVGRMPAGPAIVVVESDHAFFPALYERLVAESRPDVVLFVNGLAKSSWFLARVKKWAPELFVPFIDDGRTDGLGQRFVAENRKRGVAVAAETGMLGDTPLGRLYLRAPAEGSRAANAGLPPPPSSDLRTDTAAPTIVDGAAPRHHEAASPSLPAPAPLPLSFSGELGKRVAGRIALDRARFEVARGRRHEAARALGLWQHLDDDVRSQLARTTPTRPLLSAFVPTLTPAFLWSPHQVELWLRDLAFSAGVTPTWARGHEPSVAAELRLLNAWQLWLTGDVSAGLEILTPLPSSAWVATARMLGSVGRSQESISILATRLKLVPTDVEALVALGATHAQNRDFASARLSLEQATQIDPTHTRAWALLGRVRADAGDAAGARTAWLRSLALDPGQGDVAAWVRAQQSTTQ